MHTQYNRYNLEAIFKSSLNAEKVQPITLKNYMSDLKHFFGWLSTQPDFDDDIPRTLTPTSIQSYVLYLLGANIPFSTANRRLSTLRKFCGLGVQQGWLGANPISHMTNLIVIQGIGPEMALRFQQYLSEEGLTADEIKKNITDVKEFITLSL